MEAPQSWSICPNNQKHKVRLSTFSGFYLSRNFGAVVPGSLNASCDRDLVANLFEIECLFVGSVWVEEVEEVHVGLVVGRLVTALVQV